jgi:hypothetical protein
LGKGDAEFCEINKRPKLKAAKYKIMQHNDTVYEFTLTAPGIKLDIVREALKNVCR